jgi:hypothetical protein
MIFTGDEAPTRLDYRIGFGAHDDHGSAIGSITLRAEGGGIRVTWRMVGDSGRNPAVGGLRCFSIAGWHRISRRASRI